MRIKNIIAAICGVIVIACMAGGLPVFAAETDGVVYIDIDGDGQISEAEMAYAEALAAQTSGVNYVDIDGDGQISQAERDYAEALKAMQDYHDRLSAREAAGIYSTEFLVPEDVYGNDGLEVVYYDASQQDATEETADTVEAEAIPVWDGTPLNKDRGSIYGPSGKEVYYNLDMTPVITLAQQNGIAGYFWVRDDGVKMYGNYIMVAAGYAAHPYGSLVETSLGTAIVLDTGGFADLQPDLIDIAVRW